MKIGLIVLGILLALPVVGGWIGYEWANHGLQKQLLMHEDLAWRYAYAEGVYDSAVLFDKGDDVLSMACKHFKVDEADRAAMPRFDTKMFIYNNTKELREACENPYSNNVTAPFIPVVREFHSVRCAKRQACT